MGSLVGIDCLLSFEKHNIVHKNPLALGTKRGNIVHYTVRYLVNAYYNVHNVDVGWERSEPNELVYNKHLLPMSRLNVTHMKIFEDGGTVNGSV